MTPGAFIEAAEEFGIPRELAMRNWEGCIQARAALYLPGGRIAKELSRNPTVLVVNDTAFAHGGLLPTHGEHAALAVAPAAGTAPHSRHLRTPMKAAGALHPQRTIFAALAHCATHCVQQQQQQPMQKWGKRQLSAV